ncbi:peptide chain release factor N(5)-glutamine methyltransferase [Candidatus Peregrinibacteria bacterium]|nr:peptide chain release factor N(5)-glutamine methyltransferase [Candidatus Peregrinibacteria bacterium]
MAIRRMLQHHSVMRIRDVWQAAGIERCDGEVLTAALLGRDRSWVPAHEDDRIPPESMKRLTDAFSRRAQGEPVAYILGKRDFYGRDFFVDPSVLIPRPATEGLVDLALEMIDGSLTGTILRSVDAGIVACGNYWGGKNEAVSVIDIGTGSGCIAVTIACQRPDVPVIATDVSEDSLRIAKKNAEHHHVSGRIRFIQGSLLEPIAGERHPFVIVSNPPYVPDDFPADRDLSFEPSGALFAGPEGLDVLLPLVREARRHPLCRGFLVECREDQVASLHL